MERIWNMAELAEAVGASRQTVWSRVQSGLVPEPDYVTGRAVPYWSDAHAVEIINAWADDLRLYPRR